VRGRSVVSDERRWSLHHNVEKWRRGVFCDGRQGRGCRRRVEEWSNDDTSRKLTSRDKNSSRVGTFYKYHQKHLQPDAASPPRHTLNLRGRRTSCRRATPSSCSALGVQMAGPRPCDDDDPAEEKQEEEEEEEEEEEDEEEDNEEPAPFSEHEVLDDADGRYKFRQEGYCEDKYTHSTSRPKNGCPPPSPPPRVSTSIHHE